MTPASWGALQAARYMHKYGVTNRDLGYISVQQRAYAAKNPAAWFYEKPITLEDHQNSKWIQEPWLRLLDCRSEEHTSELQSLMRISYAVFCLKKKTKCNIHTNYHIP